jgi:predicted amidophosphoribosyltransferase
VTTMPPGPAPPPGPSAISGTPSQPGKFCVKCGASLPAGSTFCPSCGASQPVQ